MENITKIICGRRSIRTFDGKEVNKDDINKLSLFMEKIDLGIALCHFALAAKENAINICFSVSDPGLRQMPIQNILHRICFHSRNIIKNRSNFDFTACQGGG